MVSLAVFLLLVVTPVMAEFSASVGRITYKHDVAIDLDCQTVNGRINAFAQLNAGPLPTHWDPEGEDLTEQYRSLGITHVRTHDFWGPVDVDTIFPDWDAHPSHPSSYDFSSSDRYISAIVDAGCQVYYRLGMDMSSKTARNPPDNVSKWAEVCKHIAMHYNDGWNHGYHHNITYWEIWNEPDLEGFWAGTPQQYYQLYALTAIALKSYNASLKVGGPATSSVTNPDYTAGFLTYVADNEIPLDFYSWHQYAHTPQDLFLSSIKVRNMLDDMGFTETENINGEWNIDMVGPQRNKDNAKNAAFTACTLTAFQDACIDHAFRYRGTQFSVHFDYIDVPGWLVRLTGCDWSLFTMNGTFKTPGLAYLAVHHLAQDSPLRLTTPPMDASSGLTYLAGIDDHGTNVTILLSNYEGPATRYLLNLTRLPWNTSFVVVQYLIDDHHHLEIVNRTTGNGGMYNSVHTIATNSVHLIRITNQTALPPEGPPVASIPWLLRLRILDPFFMILATAILFLVFNPR